MNPARIEVRIKMRLKMGMRLRTRPKEADDYLRTGVDAAALPAVTS